MLPSYSFEYKPRVAQSEDNPCPRGVMKWCGRPCCRQHSERIGTLSEATRTTLEATQTRREATGTSLEATGTRLPSDKIRIDSSLSISDPLFVRFFMLFIVSPCTVMAQPPRRVPARDCQALSVCRVFAPADAREGQTRTAVVRPQIPIDIGVICFTPFIFSCLAFRPFGQAQGEQAQGKRHSRARRKPARGCHGGGHGGCHRWLLGGWPSPAATSLCAFWVAGHPWPPPPERVKKTRAPIEGRIFAPIPRIVILKIRPLP